MMYSALQNVNNNVYPKMRRGAYKVLITMTDGRSSDRNPIAVQNARKLYDHSIAIGVGTDINWAELQNLASTNNDFIFVPNFSRLNDSIAKIVEDICNKTSKILTNSVYICQCSCITVVYLHKCVLSLQFVTWKVACLILRLKFVGSVVEDRKAPYGGRGRRRLDQTFPLGIMHYCVIRKDTLRHFSLLGAFNKKLQISFT